MRTSTRGCCACSTTARSGTIRRGCCDWRATRGGSASRRSPPPPHWPRRRSRRARSRRSAASGSAPSCGCSRASRSPAALVALASHGLGAALLPGFDVDLELAERALALCPPDADAGAVALGSALSRAPAAELGARLRGLALPAAEAEAIAAGAALDELLAALGGARPSAADALLARRPLAAAVLVAAAGSEPARDWLVRARHLRVAIGGEDLLAAGLSGPAVGRGLRAARAALLDGVAADRDAQLAAALAVAR